MPSSLREPNNAWHGDACAIRPANTPMRGKDVWETGPDDAKRAPVFVAGVPGRRLIKVSLFDMPLTVSPSTR
jgi:hypothetical protein